MQMLLKRTDIKDATELYPGGMEIEDLSEFVKEKTEQYQSTLVILNYYGLCNEYISTIKSDMSTRICNFFI